MYKQKWLIIHQNGCFSMSPPDGAVSRKEEDKKFTVQIDCATITK